VEGAEQTLRKVKGILNKLTPEKFERLLSQLIPMVHGYEVLQVRRWCCGGGGGEARASWCACMHMCVSARAGNRVRESSARRRTEMREALECLLRRQQGSPPVAGQHCL
jgi:hypothetical protein